MHYDIAAKVILSRCKDAVLTELCNLPIVSSMLIESRPQETTSLRRSDFVLKAGFEDGSEHLILIEFLSFWKPLAPIKVLEYRCRHILEENLPVISVILLLTPSHSAIDCYEDEEVRYCFRLIKVYELDAEDILRGGPECLFAFIPLMRNGTKVLDEAERRIYEGLGSKEEKADLLTGMAILGGLISREIPLRLIQRRRDIMIESAAYEIIKKEGFEEGIQQGIQQGLLEDAREMVLEALEERFGLLSASIISKVKSIQERAILRNLLRIVIKVEDLGEFKEILKRIDE